MSGGAFTGFDGKALDFFAELEIMQERAWFLEHKPIYERFAKGPMLDLLADLSAELARRRIPLKADPRRAIFRINRDVRFSRDKSPYKTHIGAVLTREGGKDDPGLLYVHIAPRGCFMATGFYRPEPDQLALIRARIASKPKLFRAMVAALKARGLVIDADEDALKRPPRGFTAVADPDLAAAICHRSLIIRAPLSFEDIAGPQLVGILANFAAASMPLLGFGWEALGYLPEG
jgi:uncharacterized protein (TIGR02453 family)